MSEITHRKKRLSSFKLIVLGFAGVILLGALILMLPFSSTAGVVTPFHEALFTSTSAKPKQSTRMTVAFSYCNSDIYFSCFLFVL